MTHRTASIRYLAFAGLSLALSACGSSDTLRESLGLNHKAPDEYRVYARPPLSVPPEFNLTAPTKPGHEGDVVTGAAASIPASEQARQNILGQAAATSPTPFASRTAPGISPDAPVATPAAVPNVLSSELPSASDSQFLSDAGALHADPHIREQLEEDKLNGTGVAVSKDSTYLFGPTKNVDTEVDADKEAKRLAADKAQDKPPTTGDTPVIQPQDKGFLGGLF